MFAEILRHPPRQHTLFFPALGMPLLVWVMAGNVLIREREAGGGWTQLPVERGHIFLTTSGKPYELSWTAEGRDDFIVMHVCLGIDLMGRVARTLHGSEKLLISDYSGRADRTFVRLLTLLKRELTGDSASAQPMIEALSQALALHVVRSHAMPIRTGGIVSSRGLSAESLAVAVSALSDIASPVPVADDLARRCGLSVSQFSRAFKQSTGLSPHAYATRSRMEKAKSLLETTDLPILQVGLDVGYTSASHFTAQFVRAYGITPSAFRRDTRHSPPK
ncbi:MAG: helix-turn-helix transcriptional regulator [Luteibacter sp.]